MMDANGIETNVNENENTNANEATESSNGIVDALVKVGVKAAEGAAVVLGLYGGKKLWDHFFGKKDEPTSTAVTPATPAAPKKLNWFERREAEKLRKKLRNAGITVVTEEQIVDEPEEKSSEE